MFLVSTIWPISTNTFAHAVDRQDPPDGWKALNIGDIGVWVPEEISNTATQLSNTHPDGVVNSVRLISNDEFEVSRWWTTEDLANQWIEYCTGLGGISTITS